MEPQQLVQTWDSSGGCETGLSLDSCRCQYQNHSHQSGARNYIGRHPPPHILGLGVGHGGMPDTWSVARTTPCFFESHQNNHPSTWARSICQKSLANGIASAEERGRQILYVGRSSFPVCGVCGLARRAPTDSTNRYVPEHRVLRKSKLRLPVTTTPLDETNVPR